MKHSAHKAEHGANGKTAIKTTAISRGSHAATSHRAQRTGLFFFKVAQAGVRSDATSHRAVSARPTSHRMAPAPKRALRAHAQAGTSTLVLSRMSSTKLVALFGLVAMLGTGGVVATANATSGNAPAFATTTNVNTAVSSVSFNLSGSSSGSAVSRSATRSDTSAADSSQASQTDGQWDLEGSTDSINAKKVSVASVTNAAVQKKLESGVTPPDDFDANHATGDTGNAYSFSQCTWWAYKRRKQLGLPVGSHFGNGAQWAASAKALGYWVDNNPQVGDVMVFATGQEGASSAYGHVAIVEKIEDGAVITSESGASLNGDTMSRTFENVHDFQYIHF